MFSTKCENYMYSADYISLTVCNVCLNSHTKLLYNMLELSE